MNFLTKQDFKVYVQDDILDDIIEMDSRIIDQAVDLAIELVKGYLNARYTVADIFTATGTDRHNSVVDAVLCIAIYKLHSRIQPTAIPDHRKEDYNNMLDWLEKVSEAKINPVGLPEPEEGEKDYIKVGSNEKRDNHI
jgi:phage gp36-like protein